MSQAERSPFSPLPSAEVGLRLVGASLALPRHLAGLWAKLAAQQLAFAHDSLQTALEELKSASGRDSGLWQFDWQLTVQRRVFELGFRHMQRMSELVLETQQTLASELGKLLASAVQPAQATSAQPAAETSAQTEAPATTSSAQPAAKEEGPRSARRISPAA